MSEVADKKAQTYIGKLKEQLEINGDSKVLFINTEGNTDPISFRQIIWDGMNPVPEKFWTER